MKRSIAFILALLTLAFALCLSGCGETEEERLERERAENPHSDCVYIGYRQDYYGGPVRYRYYNKRFGTHDH